MKYARLMLLIQLLPLWLWSQTGDDCTTAIPLTLDGVCRTYATSSVTGASVVCTSYTGTSPVTYFTFTTNSTPDRVLVDITAPTAEPCEVALYSSGCGSMYSSGGMCFDDGKGLWSFSSNFTVLPNTTYKLRIKTTSSGNLTICAKNYTPPNNSCAGATSIGPTPVSDNNACHMPGSEISSVALGCGFTLENTAFYKFYVASDGVCVVNIGSISCDNGNSNNSNGFQAIYFSGDCSSLLHLGCESNTNSGSGTFLQFTTPALTAGTKVTVAIDGLQGSNCSYNISGINILSVLDAELENFTGWKTETTNLLKWTVPAENKNIYLVERSENGRTFHEIGRLNSTGLEKQRAEHSFEDRQPAKKSYYRIKQIGLAGKISLSSVILLERNDVPEFKISLVNPVVGTTLDMQILGHQKKQYSYTIYTLGGQFFASGNIICTDGYTRFKKDISALASGKYLITLVSGEEKITRSFIKMN